VPTFSFPVFQATVWFALSLRFRVVALLAGLGQLGRDVGPRLALA
jgi:hypothetical protein